MSILEEKTFSAYEIRDGEIHEGGIVFNGEFTIKTIIIENSLDKSVALQCEASMHKDFSNHFPVGGEFEVAANKNTYQSSDTYFPYWRVVAKCSEAPTVGNLTVHVIGVPT